MNSSAGAEPSGGNSADELQGLVDHLAAVKLAAAEAGKAGEKVAKEQLIERAEATSSMEEVHEILSSTEDVLVKRKVFEIVAARIAEASDALRGDYADFHNVATEGFRCCMYESSLCVIETGLTQWEGNPTLVGDRVQALKSLGRAQDCLTQALQFWACTSPRKFAADWRVAVFLQDTIEQIDPSFEDTVPSDYVQLLPEGIRNGEATITWGGLADAVLQTVCTHNPHHIKVWHELAEVHIGRGDVAAAVESLKEGLGSNPLSQQLRFSLGQLLLQQAAQQADDSLKRQQIDEAIGHLEDALRTDFQEQFQHDVHPIAVMLRLAQAYDAKAVVLGDTDAMLKAQSVYEQLQDEPGHLGRYASDRLRHIRTYSQVSVRLDT